LENKLGDLIDKISEKFANDNRKEEPVPQKKPKPEFKDEHKDDPEVFGPYYDLLDDSHQKNHLYLPVYNMISIDLLVPNCYL